MTDPRLPWLVAVALAATIAPARAGGALITPPAGWHSDPEQATALGQRYASGQRGTVAAEAYAADPPGAALAATRVTIELAKPDDAGALARHAIDELRRGPQRARLSGGDAHEDAWHAAIDAATQQAIATLSSSEPSSHTAQHARLVIASDGTKLVAVTGECLGRDDRRAALETCKAALASLDPGIPLASRVGFALPDNPTPVEVIEARPPPSMSEAKGLDDGSIRLPPTTIKLDPPAPDRRPMYVGAGILVLAALFWWNRRHREQIERAELRAERREQRDGRRAERRRSRDDDADDLHAAARGDGAASDPDDLDVNSAPRDPS